MAFQARYSGLCLPCGEDIKPGEWLTTHPQHGHIHEECTDIDPPEGSSREGRAPSTVLPRGKTAQDRCGACFLVHSTGQEQCE
jgi:hypothetical protein